MWPDINFYCNQNIVYFDILIFIRDLHQKKLVLGVMLFIRQTRLCCHLLKDFHFSLKINFKIICQDVIYSELTFDCRLGEIIVPPRIVNELSWVANYWPSDIPSEDVQYVRPEVQRYCLMGTAGSYTDFHVDFGGSSVWYHVLRV